MVTTWSGGWLTRRRWPSLNQNSYLILRIAQGDEWSGTYNLEIQDFSKLQIQELPKLKCMPHFSQVARFGNILCDSCDSITLLLQTWKLSSSRIRFPRLDWTCLDQAPPLQGPQLRLSTDSWKWGFCIYDMAPPRVITLANGHGRARNEIRF